MAVEFRDKMKRLQGLARTSDLQATADAVGCSVQTVRNAMAKSEAYKLTETELRCITELTQRVQVRRVAVEKLERLIAVL